MDRCLKFDGRSSNCCFQELEGLKFTLFGFKLVFLISIFLLLVYFGVLKCVWLKVFLSDYFGGIERLKIELKYCWNSKFLSDLNFFSESLKFELKLISAACHSSHPILSHLEYKSVCKKWKGFVISSQDYVYGWQWYKKTHLECLVII